MRGVGVVHTRGIAPPADPLFCSYCSGLKRARVFIGSKALHLLPKFRIKLSLQKGQIPWRLFLVPPVVPFYLFGGGFPY